MYQFLKINSFSLFEEIIIVANKEENWYLVFYQFIFVVFNLVSLFVIFVFKPFPIICFGIIILLMIIEISILLVFCKKSLRFFIFFNIFTLVVFLLWVVLVGINKCFNIKFPLVLNICFVTANLCKLISQIILSITVYKMVKEIRLKI